MSRIVRIFEGVALGFLDIHKLRPRLNLIPTSTASINLLTLRLVASMGEVTEKLKSDQPIWVGASILLPSKSKI